jgi:hypothetical protein
MKVRSPLPTLVKLDAAWLDTKETFQPKHLRFYVATVLNAQNEHAECSRQLDLKLFYS